VFVASDLLYLNGNDLRKLPLIERKAQLEKIIHGTDIQFSENFEIDGPKMYAHACEVGLEGLVSKHRDRRYRAGRSPYWEGEEPQAPSDGPDHGGAVLTVLRLRHPPEKVQKARLTSA
jgi:hypothetical protein